MSTAANHRKRSHRSQSKHWKAAGHHVINSVRKQDTGFGLFAAALRKMIKRWKREKKADEVTD